MASVAFTRVGARPLLLLALLAAALSAGAVGCGDVKKCKKGAVGCVEGEPFTSGDNKGGCSFGLIVNDEGLCAEPDDATNIKQDGGTPGKDAGTDAGRDAGGDAGRDGGTPGECSCASDEVCSPEDGKTCLNYCDEEPELKAVKPPPGCRDYSGDTVATLTFKEACTNACLQNCKRSEIFCPGFVCDTTACNSAAQTAECLTLCPTSDPECMTKGCESVRDLSCADFLCPAAYPKSCTDVKCSNTCAAINIADNYCDDGDPLSASYTYCAYGTDCSDCGPRRGPKPPVAQLGGQCAGPDVGCPGFDPDFLKTDSWCLNVPGTPPAQFACIPNCTGHESEADYCTSGFKCEGIQNGDGTPFTNSNGLQGYGCVPQVCE